MGIIDPPIPKLGITGSQPATDLVASLEDIRDELNGLIETVNLKDRAFNECPVPRWKEVKVAPEIKIAGGPYTPGTDPVKYGPQNLAGAWPSAPASNVLREMAFQVKWSKAAKFGGGNDDTNQMVFQMYNSEDAESGHTADPVFGILVPGTDGLRTSYTAGVVTTGVTLVDFAYVTVAATSDTGQQMILPTIGDSVTVQATGANGLFSGIFTLHEFVLRYRDWEF